MDSLIRSLTIIALASTLNACTDCDCDSHDPGQFCELVCDNLYPETGGDTGDEEHGNIACDERGICVTSHPGDSEFVQDVVTAGLWQPHRYDAFCIDPVWSWDCFGDFDINAVVATCSYCPSEDFAFDSYAGPEDDFARRRFNLCWPESAAWLPIQEQGTVGRPGAYSDEFADCSVAPPYLFSFGYDFQMECGDSGVWCARAAENCTCRCGLDNDYACIAATALWFPDDTEAICEGYPIMQDGPDGCVLNF
jgi:hypothetical protein